MKMTRKKCLIVGSSGLIGTRLLKDIGMEWEPFSLSNNDASGANGKNGRHFNIDLTCKWDSSILPDKIDAVIYLAQSEHYGKFPMHALNVFQINTLGVLRLLEYARVAGARTFIFASSGGLDKDRVDKTLGEAKNNSNKDIGFYLSTKLCSEIISANYASYLNIVVLRFFFVYGPGQRRSMLLPRLTDFIQKGKRITLYGSEGVGINPIHVSDATRVIKSALSFNKSYKIDIAGPKVYSLRQISEIIGKRLGKKPIFDIKLDARPKDIIGDISEMVKLAGPPRVFFEKGVRTI